MSAPAGIRALTFDVFGTLVDWRSSIAAEAARILGRDRPETDWEAFADSWRRRYQPSMDRVRKRDAPWTLLDDLHAESLDGVLGEHGFRRIAKSKKHELVRAWHRLEPWPDVREGLTRLGARFRLATLSNGNIALLQELVEHARLPFDEVISAEHANAYKPDPRTYLTAVERLGVAPGETLMVAAHMGDLAAAGQLGLRTAFVARPLEWGPSETPLEPPKPWLDIYVRDLGELATALGC